MKTRYVFEVPEYAATPSDVPATGTRLLYVKTNNQLYTKDSFSVERSVQNRLEIALASPTASNSTLTLQDVTGMSVTLRPSTTYDFRCNIIYTTAAATTGIALGMGGTGFSTLRAVSHIPTGIAAASYGQLSSTTTSGIGTASGGATAWTAQIWGVVVSTAGGGTFFPRYASEVNGSSVVVQTYSTLIAEPIG